MGSMMRSAPTLLEMSEVEEAEAVTTTLSRHERSSSEIANTKPTTDLSDVTYSTIGI